MLVHVNQYLPVCSLGTLQPGDTFVGAHEPCCPDMDHYIVGTDLGNEGRTRSVIALTTGRMTYWAVVTSVKPTKTRLVDDQS